MAERRSLGQALELTREELAFINGNQEPGPAKTSLVVERTSSDAKPSSTSRRQPLTETKNARVKKPTSKQSVDPPADSAIPDGLLVPITTRLRPATVNALRRAVLEHKLHRKKPSTQQEIVESAVRKWLGENGYYGK